MLQEANELCLGPKTELATHPEKMEVRTISSKVHLDSLFYKQLCKHVAAPTPIYVSRGVS